MAAARLLGQDKGGSVTGVGAASSDASEADTSASERRAAGSGTPNPETRSGGARKSGQGIDGPTSHIDRNAMPSGEMPDLGKVRHPSSSPAETRRETESHARPPVTVGSRRGRGPMRAAMQLRSVDPWSALKVSLLVSVAMFLVWMVAVAIIYVVLDGMGVWDRLNTGVTDIMSGDSGEEPTLIGPGQIFGIAAIVGIINIVLFTALSTLGAFIYNLSSDMVGGVEVTLADRD
ncbi:MAG: DUF3566 domain-containing protein [Tomitella sp.]|nr:DUF3566 domain-containing protein [Tomitella sp.]